VAGKSVLITGATGALGGAAAWALTQAGAVLTLAGANEESLARLAAELGSGPSAGPRTRPVPPVISTVPRRPETPDDAAEMVRAAVAAHGRLDGVLVASGMNHVAPITAMDVADFQRVQDANVRGSWLVCQAAGRQLIEQGQGGSVVLVSSTRGRLGHPAGYSAYCPSKSAVIGLTRAAAAEFAPDIRVNAICPGGVSTPMSDAHLESFDDKEAAMRLLTGRQLIKRYARPDEIASVAVFLASDEASFMTGAVVPVEAGHTAW